MFRLLGGGPPFVYPRVHVHIPATKLWSIIDIAQDMFRLREISQMEGEMCRYLEWELNVDPVTLREFEEMIRKVSVPALHTSAIGEEVEPRIAVAWAVRPHPNTSAAYSDSSHRAPPPTPRLLT